MNFPQTIEAGGSFIDGEELRPSPARYGCL